MDRDQACCLNSNINQKTSRRYIIYHKKIEAEYVAKEARRYKTLDELKKMSPDVYQRATELAILSKVCRHMHRKSRPRKWTVEVIAREAKQYQTISQFRAGSRLAYNAMMREGMKDALCAHMAEIKSKSTKYDKASDLFKEASKFKTREGFAAGSQEAYGIALKRGLMDKICRHMDKEL